MTGPEEQITSWSLFLNLISYLRIPWWGWLQASSHVDQAVVCAGSMIHPEAVVTVLIQSLTHSKPSTVSCNTFLLNLNNSIRITSHSLIACTFPFMVEPNTALFWFSCQSLSVPVYIFTASHVDVLFDSVPCLWSQFLRFVIVSIGPSHLKWAQTRIQMIYLESLGAPPSLGHAHNTSGNDC